MTFEELIKKCIREDFEYKMEKADLETDDNPVAYGDTFVNSGNAITQEAEESFFEEYIEEADDNVYDVIEEFLANDEEFVEKVKEIIKKGEF